ncbi:hypothetical protein GOBAR_DD06084 [Gossypium barbadense]|nr:hypothetical protein GOBAR_DD06084 [Gossypium barbadense]
MDLTAIHEMLEKNGYKNDEGVANEGSNLCFLFCSNLSRSKNSEEKKQVDGSLLSFQMWTDQIQETLNSKKRGDTAFRAKEFETAIECYTHFIGGMMVSPTVFARRCLCYMLFDMPQEALGDAMQAQVISPEWPTAFYLQAAALFSLGMDKDALETLKDGTDLEARKHS